MCDTRHLLCKDVVSGTVVIVGPVDVGPYVVTCEVVAEQENSKDLKGNCFQ